MKGLTHLAIGMLVMMIITMSYFVMGDLIESFYAETNPLNITFSGGENHTKFVSILRYSTIQSFNFTVSTYPIGGQERFYQIPKVGNLSFGLVSYHSFTNTGTDVTGNDHNMSLTDMLNDTGKYLSGRRKFTGTSIGIINNSIKYGNLTDFTINFWLNTTHTIPSATPYYYITKTHPQSTDDFFEISRQGGQERPQVLFNTEGNDANCGGITSLSGLNDGRFHMHTVMRNNTNLSIWSDGRMINSTICDYPINQSGEWYVGSLQIQTTSWIGIFDELAIYNRTLTNEELLTLNDSFYPFYLDENLTIYISNTSQSVHNINDITENISIGVATIANLLTNCICSNCTILGDSCLIPTTYNFPTANILEIDLNNITIFTNLTFNVYDIITNSLMTQDAGLDIVGFGNFTASSGLLNIPQFSIEPGPWTVITSSGGYATNTKEFTLTDIDSTLVNIYLINLSAENSGNLIVNIFDEFFNTFIGANVKLLEYQPVTDTFIEISQCYSNSNGECIFPIELNTKFYIVTATGTRGGEILVGQSTSTGEIIRLDNTIVEIHLSTTDRYDSPDDTGLVITVTNTSLISNVSYLTAIFDDVNNNNHTVCVEYFFRRGTNDISLANPTCVNGTTGIVNAAGGFILDLTLTNIAKVYSFTNGVEKLFDEYVYPAEEDSFLGAYSIYTKYILLAILLGILGLSLWLKNIGIFGGGTIAVSLSVPFFDPSLIGAITTVFLIILGIMIIAVSYKRKQ